MRIAFRAGRRLQVECSPRPAVVMDVILRLDLELQNPEASLTPVLVLARLVVP